MNKIKNIKDAYTHTMGVVNSLEKQGIEVVIQIPKIIKDSDNPEELSIIKKYINNPNSLHWSDWKTIHFKITSEDEADKVSFARRYLLINGCYFDSGGLLEGQDWEIDWSFSFSDKEVEDDKIEEFEELIQMFSLGRDINI